ncbi:30S ribosomal protein S5 [Patescibacteria group bacterium]|nr:30S ribosomal protein S5 [Patescibacteria group bacterium]
MPIKKITKRQPRDRNVREYEQQLVDLARVTRVVKGGKRMRFRACLVIGNKKGKIGVGVAKGLDVAIAVQKAMKKATKEIKEIKIVNHTIPHAIKIKHKSARILLRPAKQGHGIVAGGVVRIVLTLVGIENVTAKILGSKNKINNVRATIKALESFND